MMVVYKQLVFIVGNGLVVFSATGSIYWSLGVMGFWMMLLGPLTDYPVPRSTERLTFPQILYLINHPSQCIQLPRCNLTIPINTKELLQDALSDG